MIIFKSKTLKPNRFQRTLTQPKLNFWLSLYFASVLNYALYAKVWQLHPFTGLSSDYFIFSVPVFIFCACYVIFSLLAIPYLHKVIMPLLLVISAAISYNAIFFDVYFNRDMLTNVLQTTPAESQRLLTVPFVLWIVVFGVLPALAYLKVKVRYRTWWQELLSRVAYMSLAIFGIGVIALFFYQDYASFGRNNLSIKHLIVPTNFMSASFGKYKRYRQDQMPYEYIDVNASLDKTDTIRNVAVIIVGETTRGQNWGLNGYVRQTTPKLAKRGDEIINFTNVSSCNTFTAGSVPCMFSHLPRQKFDIDRAEKQDNLLDIAQRVGNHVLWIDNNSGCKGVCKNVSYIDVTQTADGQFCQAGECLDNILLPELDKALAQIDKSNQDALIVLHTIGSHGPTYYERYTSEYRQFTPTCDTNQINKCSNEHLLNTYDNTILYADQFIDQVIDRLAQRPDWRASVLYVSDHGESLGEKGIYLHSTPYDIAPKYQTHVPMILWLNKTWYDSTNINQQCLQQNANTQQYSHDNLYSTLFSIMQLTKQGSYQAQLDIIQACS